MADPITVHDVDIKTRANLAYIWSAALIIFVGYILWEYGHILAVLTLMVGFITGTAATVLAVYFGAQLTTKKPEQPIVTTNSDTTNVNVNPADTSIK